MRIVWGVQDVAGVCSELTLLGVAASGLQLVPSADEGLHSVDWDEQPSPIIVFVAHWSPSLTPPPDITNSGRVSSGANLYDPLWCCHVREWSRATGHGPPATALRLVAPDTDNEELVHPYFRQRRPGWCGLAVRANAEVDLQSLEIEWVDSGALATGNRYLEDRALLFYRGALLEIRTN